jgi:hypothetical protein
VDLQRRFEVRQTLAAVSPDHGAIDCAQVEQAKVVGLAQDPSEPLGPQDVGQVDDRPRHRGDRDAADRGDLIVVEASDPVETNPRRPGARPPRRGHVHGP